MNKLRAILLGVVILVAGFAGALFAGSIDRTPVEYFKGHTHIDGATHGAPEHSGGTDARGCHNGSVPYHCH